MGSCGEHFSDGTALDYLAFVQNCNAVAYRFDGRKVVRDQKNAATGLPVNLSK
jgi:hypothetical protein